MDQPRLRPENPHMGRSRACARTARSSRPKRTSTTRGSCAISQKKSAEILNIPAIRATARHLGVVRIRHIDVMRSEEHTSELQSRGHLVCRLLLEKKKQHQY